jgi:uncharacterized Zn-binding protein involved in type VI secretion
MGQPAARVGDMIRQDSPHCHAPIHPPAPTPTPVAHPALPLAIMGPGCPTVRIGGMTAAIMLDQSMICMLPSCVPNGPGLITKCSMTVFCGNFPAARVGDLTSHPGCVAPIPAPMGRVQPPGCPTVMIGG